MLKLHLALERERISILEATISAFNGPKLQAQCESAETKLAHSLLENQASYTRSLRPHTRVA